MKRMKLILTLVTTILFFQNLKAQDCIILPDTLFHCGFELEINPNVFHGGWGYNCIHGPGDVSMTEIPTGYIMKFSECGTYELDYFYFDEFCEEIKRIVFEIDDPSATEYNLYNDNAFDYPFQDCIEGAATCSNIVVIDGGITPDPEWELCQLLECFYNHYVTSTVPENPNNCIAEDIIITSLSGSDQNQFCTTTGQEAFIVLDEITGEVISNDFFDYIDSLNNIILDLVSCPLAPAGCFSPDETCLDSITFDSLYYLFPIHQGGRWVMLENGDTIVLSDTTFVNKLGMDFLFVIDPNAQYYGPGQLTFYLYELVNGDTIPAAVDIEFSLWWQEQFTYDTLDYVVPTYHYSDEPECQPCGGNSFNSSLNIPGAPEFNCPPIIIGFGEPCSCENVEIIIAGNDLDCFEPCTQLYASVNLSDPNIVISSSGWYDQAGNYYGQGNTLTVCESDVYTYEVVTASGCTYSSSYSVSENFDVPEIDFGGPYILDCVNECIDIFINPITDPADLIITVQLPNGDFTNQWEIVVCEPGLIIVDVFSNFNGCSETFTIEVEEILDNIVFSIETPDVIDCNNDCVLLVPDLTDIPQGATFEWIGPNSFTSTDLQVLVCETGSYTLTASYGSCEGEASSTVFDYFAPTDIDLNANLCEGDCYIFQGELYCVPGTYIIEGECDTTYNIIIEVDQPQFLNKYFEICDGDVIEVDGQLYDEEGDYTYTIPTTESCDDIVFLEIDVFLSDVFVTGQDFISCDENTATLIASTSNSYENFIWYDESDIQIHTGATFTVEKAGTYVCRNYATSASCSAEYPFIVKDQTQLPNLELESQYTINCENNIELSVLTDSDATLNYTWSGPGINSINENDENPSVTEAGQYTVVIENEFGCESAISLELIQIPILEAALESDKTCASQENGSIRVTELKGGFGNILINLDGGDWSDNTEFENVSSGLHTIGFLEEDGCSNYYDIDVETIAPILPAIEVELEYDLCEVPFIDFDLAEEIKQNPDWIIEWDDGSSVPTRKLDQVGDYSLNISNLCEDREFLFSIRNSDISEEIEIYRPNIFSPNEDGVNDLFEIQSPLLFSSYELTIYDRWGSMVFESEDINSSWNGVHRGQAAKEDVYVYVLKVELPGCRGEIEEVIKFGDITLIR